MAETKAKVVDTERSPDTIIYHRAECEDHPSPTRAVTLDHDRLRNVVIGGDVTEVRELFEQMTPDACTCGTAVTSEIVTTQWPPVPVTADAALRLFDLTDGHVALRVKSLNYPEDAVDWQGVLNLDDPVRDQEWDLGVVDGRLVSRTTRSHKPVWSATSLSPDQLGVLLRKLPSRPKATANSALDALMQDYDDGHDITCGTEVPDAQ
jgi:hypothetical protein